MLGTTEWPSRNAGGPEAGPGAVVVPVSDLKAYEAVVDATHRFKEIFYEDVAAPPAGGAAYGGGGMGGF